MTTEKKKKPFYKKWWVWLIAIIVVGAIATGGEETEKASEDKITDEESTEKADKAVDTINKANEALEELEGTEAEAETKASKPVQVYTDDQVTVSYKSTDEMGIKFLVENKTDKTLTVQADSISVNGFSSSNIIMSDDISPNSKGYATAMTDELADAGTPEKISGQLRVIDMQSTNYDTKTATFTDVAVK
jgi:hypothetical protein